MGFVSAFTSVSAPALPYQESLITGQGLLWVQAGGRLPLHYRHLIVSEASTMAELASNQIRYLRAKAHHLKPVVLLGANGVTPAVLNEINLALDHHEMIKIKVSGEDREQRVANAAAIVEQTGGVHVQFLGHTLTLFRAKKKDSAFVLPKANKN